MAKTEKSNGKTGKAREKKLISRSKLIFYIFSVFIFLFVVYYFSKIKTEIKLLGKVNVYWLLPAVLAQGCTYLFNAIIYRSLLGAYKLQKLPSLWDLFQVSIVSLFFNQTVPSAGVSGNTFFFNFLVKRNMPIPKIISLILAELLTFYAAMELIVVFFLIGFLFFHKLPSVFLTVLIAGFAIYIVFGVLIIVVGKKRSFDLLYKKIKRIKFIKKFFENLKQKWQQQATLKREEHALFFLRDNKWIAIKTLLFQLIIFAADGFTLFALFNGLGVHASAFVVLLSLACTKIISILPFLPGSLILYESGMTYFFVGLGIPFGPSIIVTLLYRLFSFWVPIPIGLVLYRRLNRSV